MPRHCATTAKNPPSVAAGYATSCLCLANALARQQWRRAPFLEFDELLGEANARLVIAARSFNANLGYKFTTYATTAIVRHLARYADAAWSRWHLRQSQRSAILTPCGSQDEPVDYREDTTGEVEQRDMQELARRFCRLVQYRVSEKQWQVLWMRLALGMQCKAIGAAMGVTKQAAQSMLYKVLARLRKDPDVMQWRGRLERNA